MTTINWTYFMPQRSIAALRPGRGLSLQGAGKWGAIALALLVPGSFVVLPVWWLVGRMKGPAMNQRNS